MSLNTLGRQFEKGGPEMKQVPPALQELARGLLEREAAERPSPEELADAAVRACLRLCERLTRLIGRGGVDALFARAVKLAGAELPWLQEVNRTAQAELWLQEMRDSSRGREPAEVANCLLTVLANFLWLLATLIGEDLVSRLVAEAPPKSRPRDAGSRSEETTP